MIIFKMILQQEVEGEEQSVEMLNNNIFLSHRSFLGITHISTSQFVPPTSSELGIIIPIIQMKNLKHKEVELSSPRAPSFWFVVTWALRLLHFSGGALSQHNTF